MTTSNTESEQPIELDTTDAGVPGPDWPGRVLAAPTQDELLDVMGMALMAQCLDAVRLGGRVHLALAGDAALLALWNHLMLDPKMRGMPWPSTHVWQAAETVASKGSSGGHWGRLAEVLVPHAGVPTGQLHPMPATDDAAAEHYSRRLDTVLNGQAMDCIVVCASQDGCIGALAPGQPACDASVSSVNCHGEDIIALSAGTLADAKQLMILVADSQVRDRIDADLSQPHSPVSQLLRMGAQPVWCVSTSTVG